MGIRREGFKLQRQGGSGNPRTAGRTGGNPSLDCGIYWDLVTSLRFESKARTLRPTEIGMS